MSFKTRSEHAIGSLHTLSGLLMIVNFFLLFMTSAVVITWKLRIDYFGSDLTRAVLDKDLEKVTFYFMLAVAVPLVGALIIYLKELVPKEVPIAHGVAAIFMMIFCFIFAGLLVASSTFVILNLPSEGFECNLLECKQLFCGAIMSYICAVGLFGQSFIHLTEKNIVMTRV